MWLSLMAFDSSSKLPVLARRIDIVLAV